MSEQQLRIGDSERDEAAAALGEHVAQGRLTPDEHAERLDQVWSARTRADLVPIFADLPGQQSAYTGYAAPARAEQPADPRTTYWSSGLRGPGRGVPAPVVVVLALLLGLTVLTHLPLIALGVLVWLFVATRHRHRAPRGPRGPHGPPQWAHR